MKSRFGKKFRTEEALVIVCTALVALVGYSAYSYYELEDRLELVLEEKKVLEVDLKKEIEANELLSRANTDKQVIIDAFQGQIENITSTVGDLEKLSQTDPELLIKYSKVYFLNENYVPAKLADIPDEYAYNSGENHLIHAEVWPFLERLLREARSDGRELLVASAFRSFDTQANLKSSYSVIYGAGTANQFSADQGYSEHQLGTSIDFTTPALGAAFSKFEKDSAYQWLLDNARDYGFVLSYPKGNTYYIFEPWHWRFVGVDLARDLHAEGKFFYDLEQREIDKYLIKLFD